MFFLPPWAPFFSEANVFTHQLQPPLYPLQSVLNLPALPTDYNRLVIGINQDGEYLIIIRSDSSISRTCSILLRYRLQIVFNFDIALFGALPFFRLDQSLLNPTAESQHFFVQHTKVIGNFKTDFLEPQAFSLITALR
jgi:hypothetical protein